MTHTIPSKPRPHSAADTSLVIRNARFDDKDALAHMAARFCSRFPKAEALDIIALVDLLKADAPWMRLIVAEKNGEAVGYAALSSSAHMQHGQRVMRMEHLFVSAAHRCEGIGSALIERARLVAIAKGCATLKASASADNLPARATYTAVGFEPVASTAQFYALAVA